MFNTTDALVLREVRYKEADRILTVFTQREGKITVKARGALRKSSKTAAATQQLTYSEMTLFGNNGRWTVNEAVIKEPFSGLRNDIAKFALGSYFAECIEAMSVEEQPEPLLLQLGLNSLYALSNDLHDPLLIKAAFEFRLMCIAGYEPDVRVCCVCGNEPQDAQLCLENGGICCRDCKGSVRGNTVPLGRDGLSALRYIVSAPAKQLFSFQVDDVSLRRLSNAAELYIQTQTERSFSTLEYWKRVK